LRDWRKGDASSLPGLKDNVTASGAFEIAAICWERSRGLPGGSERIKSKRMRIESEAAKKTGSTVSIIIVIMGANDQVLVEAR